MAKKEIKYKLLVYDLKEYTTKEELNKDIALIKNRILDYPKELSIKEVSECCIRYPLSFSYGVRAKSSLKAYKNKNWRQQQLIAVDIDNDLDKKLYLSYKNAINLCIKNHITPSIVYTTHSSTDNCNRYRMVFALDEIITDIEEYKQILNGLANLLSIDYTTIIDVKCSDVSRLFYPGNEVVYLNENISIKKESILSLNTVNYINTDNKKSTICSNSNISNVTNIENSTCSNNNNCINILIEQVLYIKQLFKNNRYSIKTLYNIRTLYNNSNNILRNPLNYRNSYTPFLLKFVSPTAIRVSGTLFDYLHKIPLNYLIGQEFMVNFPCILGIHQDKHPSARIEQDDTGRYIYHCYACNTRYDIIDLIAKIAHVNRIDAINFLCVYFNIKYKSDWQQYQTEVLISNMDYLRTDIFKQMYPLLYKTLQRKNLYPVLDMLIDLARLYLCDKSLTNLDLPVFYLTMDQIDKQKEFYGITKKKQVLYSNIKYLARLGLINILQDKNINDNILNYLQKVQLKFDRQHRIDCYAIPEFTHDLFESAENRVKLDKEKNIRSKHVTIESVSFNDPDLAQKMFAQDDPYVSKELLTKYKQFKQRAIKLLDKQGFFIEKDLTSYFRNLDENAKERISVLCLPKLIQELNIKRVSFTKRYESMFNTSKNVRYKKLLSYGCSKIFIKKEEE